MSKRLSEREQLSLFRALPHGDMALRDAQDLMAYPFFSLAKSPRIVPIRFEAGGISLTVEGVPEHGIATIWDADVLIWAASQIIQAKKPPKCNLGFGISTTARLRPTVAMLPLSL